MLKLGRAGGSPGIDAGIRPRWAAFGWLVLPSGALGADQPEGRALDSKAIMRLTAVLGAKLGAAGESGACLKALGGGR